MRSPHGTPIWYEYHAADADRAQAFYTRLFGWQVTPSGDVAGLDCRIVSTVGGAGVGGLMPAMAERPSTPGWLFYVGGDDVDATVAAAQRSGGSVLMPAVDMPGVGRMALLADPDGQRFCVMRGAMDEPSRAFAPPPATAPGQMVWNELSAADQDAALGFYAALFGWRHDGAIPMGPPGDYRMVHAGDTCIGATMPVVPGGVPGWLFYVEVDDIDAAAARVAAAGGTLLEQPTEIPGGGFSAVAADPDGARIGLVGSRRA